MLFISTNFYAYVHRENKVPVYTLKYVDQVRLRPENWISNKSDIKILTCFTENFFKNIINVSAVINYFKWLIC